MNGFINIYILRHVLHRLSILSGYSVITEDFEFSLSSSMMLTFKIAWA